jgi:galactose mutarotase-like enzyme
MADSRWVLTDISKNVYLPEFSLSPQMPDKFTDVAKWFPGNTDWSVTKRTLRGGLSDGVDVIDVHNGKLQFSLLATRGMGLWQGNFAGLFLGWKSPVQMPVHPAFVNLSSRGGLGWLTGYNEWMSRCGLESNGSPGMDVIPNNQGEPTSTPLTLHGRISNTPAHFVEVSVTPGPGGKLSVTGIIDETMMFGPHYRMKSTTETVPGSNSLTLIDEVTNMRSQPTELELLYHTNFGGPFLEQDAKLIAPILEVAPRDARAVEDMATWDTYRGPTTGYVEQCYFLDLAAKKSGDTLVMLKSGHGDKGVSLRFNKQQLPCFTQWKNTSADADGYVTGLEPATNYPNLKTFERKQGRVIVLKPGETYTTRMEIHIHNTADQVAAVEEEIRGIQSTQPARVHKTPQGKFSPM